MGATGPTGVASMEPAATPGFPAPVASIAATRGLAPRSATRGRSWPACAGSDRSASGRCWLATGARSRSCARRHPWAARRAWRMSLNDLEGGRSRGDRVSDDVAAGIAAATQSAEATLERIRELGLTIVTLDDPTFPSRLASIDMPPHVLYVLGDLAALDTPAAVAVVGTRRATDHGRAVASRLADEPRRGRGMRRVGARGRHRRRGPCRGAPCRRDDRRGHRVRPCDRPSPRARRRWPAGSSRSGGAIVSELGPDVVPSKGTFPRRNRIISGLADATVVVEAPARSGALDHGLLGARAGT